jgi:hypothetical protein
MRIRFRIQLITLVWIRILILFDADPDADPGYKNDADSCDPDPRDPDPQHYKLIFVYSWISVLSIYIKSKSDHAICNFKIEVFSAVPCRTYLFLLLVCAIRLVPDCAVPYLVLQANNEHVSPLVQYVTVHQNLRPGTRILYLFYGIPCYSGSVGRGS